MLDIRSDDKRSGTIPKDRNRHKIAGPGFSAFGLKFNKNGTDLSGTSLAKSGVKMWYGHDSADWVEHTKWMVQPRVKEISWPISAPVSDCRRIFEGPL